MPLTKREYNQRYYAAHQETLREAARRRYHANHDRELARASRRRSEGPPIPPVRSREYTRLWKERHPGHHLTYYLRHAYGMSVDEYRALEAAQGGRCAICGRPETWTDSRGRTQRLSVDHDHETGSVRGLLCNRCNRLLGFVGDNASLLDRASQYVRRHGRANLRSA